MLFTCDDFPMGEGNFKFKEDDYPYIVREIIQYIDEIKMREKSVALVDIIVDFSFKHGFDVEAVGDAISEDEYFKSFIEKDCQLRNIIRSDNNQMEDW